MANEIVVSSTTDSQSIDAALDLDQSTGHGESPASKHGVVLASMTDSRLQVEPRVRAHQNPQ
jgi:hypothetical protein